MKDYGWKFLEAHFLLFYAFKKYLKKKHYPKRENSEPVYRAIQNELNPFLSVPDFVPMSLNILIQLPELNIGFKYSSRVCRVLKRGGGRG